MSEQIAQTPLTCPSPSKCMEHALVLHALGIDYEFARDGQTPLLLVPSAQAAWAREQIALYEHENRARPVAASGESKFDASTAVFGYIGVLLLSAWFQTYASTDWYAAGRLQGGLVSDGQWWRVFTALTLHLDLPHLMGNLIFGTLFILVAAQALGPGVAMLSVLLGGATGNALNVVIQPPTHASVGASTAVFAALGILSVFFLWQRRRQLADERWPYRWGPVIGGVTLLAFLGVGGERTDIMAHVTGFLCGGLLGLMWGKLEQAERMEAIPQTVFGAIALGLLCTAWAVGLASYHSQLLPS